MRLTWRDAAVTVLAAGAVTVYMAVTQSWDWPLLGSYRTGVLALAVLGQAGCILAGAPSEFQPTESRSTKGPVLVIVSALGAAALMLIVIGLITGTRTPFVALTAMILLLWIVSTSRHALGSRVHPVGPAPAA